MRLLDIIFQAQAPSVARCRAGRSYPVFGAANLAPLLGQCATRYVLSDELAQLCAELAFSPKDDLTQCLDLVRIPAESMWLEWNEAAELAGCRDFFHEAPLETAEVRSRAGIHLVASPSGRRAQIRFAWSEGSGARVSPFIAAVDFEDVRFRQCPAGDLMHGGWLTVSDSSSAVAELLNVARFSLDPSWSACYQPVAHSAADLAAVRHSLGGPARSVPFLVAFLLLLNSKEGIAARPVAWDMLNRKRARSKKHALLSHLEASLALSLAVDGSRTTGESGGLPKRLPRRHHVRGHLVRRFNRLFWRRPHTRGSIRCGEVKSRTVTLSFDRGQSPHRELRMSHLEDEVLQP